jgi:hypothetical protein
MPDQEEAMRRSVAVLGFVLAVLQVSPGATTEIEDDCPTVDPFASFLFHRYPAEQKSIFKAQFKAGDSEEQSGQEGVDHVIRVVASSHRSQCAPVRLVIVHGGADFDSRGTAFEDSVSVERAFQAMKEIQAQLLPALKAAVERGEIADVSVSFTFGGLGARGAVHKSPSSEAERAVNRFVSVRFAHSPAAPTTASETPEDVTAPEPSGEE